MEIDMNSEEQELQELLASPEDLNEVVEKAVQAYESDLAEPVAGYGKEKGELIQWSSSNGRTFFPCGTTCNELTPGFYEIQQTDQGLYFEKIPVRTEGLIEFPQTNSGRVLDEIKNFWDREELFKEYQLSYKRGIMLWGPPGSGKSCTVQLMCKDVIDRGGIVVKFCHPSIFMQATRYLRQIQPNTPIVVLMEDIDSIIHYYSESSVLNILDGVDRIEKVVFLATTNYPGVLGPRIINRPSRFDKRFKIDHPDEESREIYLTHLIGEKKIEELRIDVNQWVEDTEGFSLAHLKELFVVTVILGDEYEEAIETLRSMKEKVQEDSEFLTRKAGFGVGMDAKKKTVKKARRRFPNDDGTWNPG
jgi:hypothetical protein